MIIMMMIKLILREVCKSVHLKGFPVLLVTQLIRILSRNLKFPCTAVIYCSNYDCSATTMFDFTALLMIACGSVVM